MNAPQQPAAGCDDQRINQFLASDNYELGDAELIAHLDECPTCRERMASQAGDANDWSKVTEMLQPSKFDQAGNADYSAATQCGPRTDQSAVVKEVLDSLVPSEDPSHLGRLGTYEVTGVVGVGGMGVVLKAIDPSLDRIVAVKVMSPRLANNENARKRFAREAKAAAAVLHPNVIPIHSVSSESPLPYLVMACIRGGSLQRRLEKEGPLPVVELLRIGSQIAAGLDAAHEQGLVHRDIKPENILLEEGVERVTITDFGLARAVDDNTVTQLGSIAGTPQYMSPEQARGDLVDQKSDLFSLGCVLYALCTGQAPFRDATSYGVMRKIIDEAPVPIRKLNSEIPEWLELVVNKLMAKHRDDRYRSASEVHELLDACLGHVQQPSTNPLPAVLRRKTLFTKKNVMKLLIGSSLLAVILSTSYVVRESTRPYSATNFGAFPDKFGRIVSSLPDEESTQTSGRVTVGDRQRILGDWEVVHVPLHWRIKGKSDYERTRYSFHKDHFITVNPKANDAQVPSKGTWQIADGAGPRRITLNLDGAERKAFYRIQDEFLTLFYRYDTDEFPSAFPTNVSFGESGVLLVLQRAEYPEVVFPYSHLTPGEAKLLTSYKSRLVFPNLSALDKESATALSTSKGTLSFPKVNQLTVDTARALTRKHGTWLVLDGLDGISPEVASELASCASALQLGVRNLSAEAAVALASHDGGLALPKLRNVSAEVAESLAGNGWLQLNGLTSLNKDVAKALTKHKGWLSLNGLNTLPLEAAEALHAFQGTDLDLNGIQTLDIATAESLVQIKAEGLTMNSVKTLSPDVAAALASGGFRHLSLQGLETLPEESLRILRRHQRRKIEGGSGSLSLPAKFRLPTNL